MNLVPFKNRLVEVRLISTVPLLSTKTATQSLVTSTIRFKVVTVSGRSILVMEIRIAISLCIGSWRLIGLLLEASLIGSQPGRVMTTSPNWHKAKKIMAIDLPSQISMISCTMNTRENLPKRRSSFRNIFRNTTRFLAIVSCNRWKLITWVRVIKVFVMDQSSK